MLPTIISALPMKHRNHSIKTKYVAAYSVLNTLWCPCVLILSNITIFDAIDI